MEWFMTYTAQWPWRVFRYIAIILFGVLCLVTAGVFYKMFDKRWVIARLSALKADQTYDHAKKVQMRYEKSKVKDGYERAKLTEKLNAVGTRIKLREERIQDLEFERKVLSARDKLNKGETFEDIDTLHPPAGEL